MTKPRSVLRETSHPALYYQDMLSDTRRMERYRAAIQQVVKPGDVVVDLGTGLAVLAIMAAQAGAARVYAVDVREHVVPYAQRVIEANGLADRITVIHADATKLELPEPVDVIVNELIGDFGTDENIYECVRFVADNYLKPGGKVVPRKLSTYLVGVRYVDELRGVYRAGYHGIDLAAAIDDPEFQTAAVMYGLRNAPVELTERAVVEAIDFERPMPTRTYEHDVDIEVVQDGAMQGLVGFFDAELASGISLATLPCYPGCHWLNWHWPAIPMPQIRSGETLSGRLITPERTTAATWSWAPG